MNDNLLLAYLSELGQGRWAQFRQALDYLSSDEDELYRSVKARQLSALGHVEFSFEGDMRWSVCEPTIAWLQRPDQVKGVLCGGRSPKLLKKLSEECDELDCAMTIQAQAEGPDVVSVTATSTTVGEQLASKLNLNSQVDAAQRLLEVLPNVSHYLSLCPEQSAPRGYKTERYSEDLLRWLAVEDDGGPGFYRYTHFHRDYRLKLKGTTLKTPAYIGIFIWLHQQNRVAFDYNPSTETLTIPASTILPPLFARAATLCSGALPQFVQFQHIYSQIPPEVAGHLLHKLHQEGRH